MPADRYYKDAFFQQNDQIALRDQEFHHLIHVMRGQVGEEIELVNGKGQLAKAIIRSQSKKECAVEITSVETTPKPECETILVQAVPRANRLDFILEKGTELGATQFWLFHAKLSEKKVFSDSQIEKMKIQTIAAMKQCGTLFAPEIKVFGSLKEMSELPYPAYFGDTDPKAPLFHNVWEKPKKGVLFFIGPESGFTQEEIEILHGLGVKGVKLHSNILRTDTAALAALTLITN